MYQNNITSFLFQPSALGCISQLLQLVFSSPSLASLVIRISAEDIGRWIKHVQGISLPLTAHLQRIKENSAGFPLVLDE